MFEVIPAFSPEHRRAAVALDAWCALFSIQGELNGHKGLVPSNFFEEVPDDVEVYLTNTPGRHPQDHPSRTKSKRVHPVSH